ncbi:MAG: hypothetical protein ACXWV9_05055 [Flavisolibacter sp.]
MILVALLNSTRFARIVSRQDAKGKDAKKNHVCLNEFIQEGITGLVGFHRLAFQKWEIFNPIPLFLFPVVCAIYLFFAPLPLAPWRETSERSEQT